jgi:CO dehydrogenase/acetyl-CoA synthase beta subunit
MRRTVEQLRRLVREAVTSRGHPVARRFTNEIGNPIRVVVEETRDTGTNAQTGTVSSFDALKLVVIGPTSTSENTLTLREARVLLDCLQRVLKPEDRD